jgi:amidase
VVAAGRTSKGECQVPESVSNLDATAQAEAVRSGEAKPVELVQAAIDRIEHFNPVLNAVVSDCFELALENAEQVDHALPFAGVPMLVKDNQDCVGLPTRAATRYLQDAPAATKDHPLVTRLKAAGFIPVGKSSMPELGLLAATEPEMYGPCHNPWDIGRTCGGSSGGSAAAVAAHLVPVGTASDGGGSIRIPASACGLVGLKPSRGRTPGAAWGGLAVNGVVTRSVRDSAGVLDALSTRGPGNVAALSAPAAGSFVAAVATNIPTLRIGLCSGIADRYEPEVWAAVEDTAKVLADLGHHVEEARVDLAQGDFAPVAEHVYAVVPAAIARQLDIWEQRYGRKLEADYFEPITWFYSVEGHKMSATALLEAYDAIALLGNEVAPLFTNFDVLLLPTLAEPAPPLGVWQFPAEDPMSGWVRMSQFVPPFTNQLANYLGVPAITVPLHCSAGGLPIGSQLYGQYGDEFTLLALAADLERARPWADRRPDVAAP